MLRAYDDDIARLALTVLASLAVPPNYHKCVDTSRHTTSLHKTPLMCSVLFEVIESLNFMISAEKLLMEEFEIKPDLNEASILVNQTNRLYYTDENNNEIGLDLQPVVFADDDEYLETANIHQNSSSSSSTDDSKASALFIIPSISNETRHLKDIISSISNSKVNWKQKLNFMWLYRGKRWLKSLGGRGLLLTCLHEASLVLFCCHSDSSLLSKFFQDKSEFLKDYIFLLKTGPPTTEPSYKLIPAKLRTLATQCLTAMIASRESGTSSVLSGICRFSLLQQDLGINRSQYMGLLPCIIRSSLVSLMENDLQIQTVENAKLNTEQWEFSMTSDYEDKILWCESVLIFVISLINMTSSALPTLTETGFIQTMLQVLNSTPSIQQPKQRVYLSSLILQVIDSSIGNNGQTLSVFKEAKGAEILIEKLSLVLTVYFPDNKEISLMSSSSSSSTSSSVVAAGGGGTVVAVVPYCNQILLQQLLTVLSSFFNDERAENGGNDPRQTQIAKGNQLAQVLIQILDHSVECQALVIAPAIGLITDLINGDTAPPNVLNHYLSNGLAEKALKVVEQSSKSKTGQKVIYDSLLLQSIVNLISALGITKEGIKLITDINPFPYIFSIFSDEDYYKPPHNIFRSDLASILGGGFEEILRHNPQLLTSCLLALLDQINHVITDSETMIQQTSINNSSNSSSMEIDNNDKISGQDTTGKTMKNEDIVLQFVPFFHYATTASICLEALLLRKQSVTEFLNLQGFEVLMKLHRLALGPSRYLLSALQCAVTPSNFTLGHQPLVFSIVRCASHIWDAEPSKFINLLIQHLKVSKIELHTSLKSFQQMKSSSSTINSSSSSSAATPNDEFSILLQFFLKEVSNKPVYESYNQESCVQQLQDAEVTADVFRCFARVDFLVNSVALVLKMSNPTSANISNIKICFEALMNPETIKLFQSIVNDLYVSTQSESARYKEVICGLKTKGASNHIYRLLVTGRESIVVKDGPEESSKRICRYDRGLVVLAYERVLSSNNIVKYRTNDGWVSHLKSITSTEAQIEVIDVIKDTITTSTADNSHNTSSISSSSIGSSATTSTSSQTTNMTTTLKRFNNEKLTNISAARGGLMSFFHFHSTIRNFLVSVSKTLYYTDSAQRDSSSGANSLVFGDHSHLYIELLMKCFDQLLPSTLDNIHQQTLTSSSFASSQLESGLYYY